MRMSASLQAEIDAINRQIDALEDFIKTAGSTRDGLIVCNDPGEMVLPI